MTRKIVGFTIVELLIVIVVIAILAAISVVAYNGIRQRARDAERLTELGAIQKALEIYRADFGAYPRCNTSGPNSPPTQSSGVASVSTCLLDDLRPNYLAEIPTDPIDTGNTRYYYAAGYLKTGPTSFISSNTDNYILGVKQEMVSSPTYSGWGQTGLTLLLGSSN